MRPDNMITAMNVLNLISLIYYCIHKTILNDSSVIISLRIFYDMFFDIAVIYFSNSIFCYI